MNASELCAMMATLAPGPTPSSARPLATLLAARLTSPTVRVLSANSRNVWSPCLCAAERSRPPSTSRSGSSACICELTCLLPGAAVLDASIGPFGKEGQQLLDHPLRTLFGNPMSASLGDTTAYVLGNPSPGLDCPHATSAPKGSTIAEHG